MREITESQAQDLADFSGCCITQSKYRSVYIWDCGVVPSFDTDGNIFSAGPCYPRRRIARKIKSTRPYSEQIWRPE